ncbi:MAG: hypothetical protein DCC71_22130 [Proteobacteria bacterium]|nr:MAG: hypothetical protein DCC71_22130 [Pseudomonadota bacterium]
MTTSNPAGASVYLNEVFIGKTPVSLSLKAENQALRFEREGCEPGAMQIETSTDGGAVATSVISGVLLVGFFEALSLTDGGTALYKDLPDVVTIPLKCSTEALADTDATQPTAAAAAAPPANPGAAPPSQPHDKPGVRK